MLLPYCAKPAWCDYRHTDDCGECGGCSVGDLYRIAYEKGMIPITITSFEMLKDTLRWCAEKGYTYIGHCCYEFYEKRHEIFKKAREWGAGGVLIDISGTTCYSLGIEEEEKAYKGEFQVELDLLVKDSEKILSIKNSPVPKGSKKKIPKVPSAVKDLEKFIPSYYKIPKALPAPTEDRNLLLKTDKGNFVKGKKISFNQAVVEIVKSLLLAENPVLIVGPLILWDWNKKSRQGAKFIRKLKELLPSLNILVLPDYRPKGRGIDLSKELDPPNPHLSILQGNYDLTVITGVHCYRTDFIVRLLKKHTNTKTIALCHAQGHREAYISISSENNKALRDIVLSLKKKLRS